MTVEQFLKEKFPKGRYICNCPSQNSEFVSATPIYELSDYYVHVYSITYKMDHFMYYFGKRVEMKIDRLLDVFVCVPENSLYIYEETGD